jgi:hypothetical protein
VDTMLKSMNYSSMNKRSHVSSDNFYSRFGSVTFWLSAVACIVVLGVVLLSLWLDNKLPGTTSPLESSSGDNTDWNTPIATYNDICALLGVTICTGAPPSSITVPAIYGSNIDVASARAKNDVGNFVVSVIGTDNEVGYYTSDPSTKSYVSILKQAAQSLYGHGGDGFRYLLSSDNFTRTLDWNNAQQESYSNFGLDKLGVSVNLNGWLMEAGSGPGAAFAYSNTNNVLSALFKGRGSEISTIHGIDCNNSPDRLFVATLDGRSASVNVGGRNPYGCTTGSPPPNSTRGFWKSSLMYQTSDQVHTVNLSTSGSVNGQLSGVRFRNPTGVVFDNYAKAVHYVATSNNAMIYDWNGSSGRYWGTTLGNSFDNTSASMWSGGNIPGRADMLLYAISPYDAEFSTDLFNQISGNIILPKRAVTNNQVDIILIFPPLDVFAADTYNIPRQGNQRAAFTTANLVAWQSFVTQMTTWATQYNIATLDLGKHYRTYTAPGFVSTNNAITNMINLGLIGNKASLGNAGSDFPLYSNAGHAEIAKLLLPLMFRKYTPNV